jgi:mycothiol synthase
VIFQRPATSLADLAEAESVLTTSWLGGAPFVASHPGDLEWWFASVAPDALHTHLHVWCLDDSPRAWSWIQGHVVHWEIRPGDPTADVQLLEAILEAAIAETSGRLEAWAPEDDERTQATLARLGFRRKELRLSQFQRRVDGGSPIGDAVPPAGYTIRHVYGADEIPARVEIHRAAFAPSEMTVEKYTRLTTLPHYSFKDDLVVEAPDGVLAAFAMAWWDPAARVGEFEPVGTHPDHQRRGLGRALLSHGLRRYRDLGAGVVQIYSMSVNEASEGLYQAVGFERRRYRHHFVRPPDE